MYRQPSGAVAAHAGQPDSQTDPLAVSSDLILANRYGPVSQQRVQPVKTQRVCDNIGDLMTTPQMKTTIEELQTEQLRNAAEAKAIYWYPGRDQRRKTMNAKDTTCQ